MTKVGWCKRPGTIPITLNISVGCNKASIGCLNCYAERMSARLAAMAQRECAWCGSKLTWDYKTIGGSAHPCLGLVYYNTSRSYLENGNNPYNCLAMLCQDCHKEYVGHCPYCWHNDHLASAKHAYLYVVCGEDDSRKPLPEWNGIIKLIPKALDVFCRWKNPRTVFVNSMSDLFHPEVPDSFIQRAWMLMSAFPQHTFIILTKRATRMKEWTTQYYGTRPADPNIWGLVSVESQEQEWRIKELLSSRFAIKGLSCEPLLGPLDLDEWLWYLDAKYPLGGGAPEQILEQTHDLDWIIAGPETGPGARLTSPNWLQSLQQQSNRAGVPFFFKGWGDWVDYHNAPAETRVLIDQGRGRDNFVDDCRVYKVGKRYSGNFINGQVWKQWPPPSK